MRERELEDGSGCEVESWRMGLAEGERAGGWVWLRERELADGARSEGERAGVRV